MASGFTEKKLAVHPVDRVLNNRKGIPTDVPYSIEPKYYPELKLSY